MDFGKVFDPTRRDLSLAPESPRSRLALLGDRRSDGTEARLLFGCPVWSHAAWVGKLFPSRAAPTDFLAEYSRRLNAVELNSTHYAVPDAATFRRWREATPSRFRFFPKFPQEISHRRELLNPQPLLREFLMAIRGLQDRLGPAFLQLPPTFGLDRLPLLTRFLDLLPTDLEYAVEVRHSSFFVDRQLAPAFAGVLEERRITAIVTDTAGRRDVAHSDLTCGRAMIRFQGNELHPTDFERASAWAERIRGWTASGLREVAFFAHQPGETLGPELLSAMMKNLGLPELELGPRREDPTRDQLALF